MAQVWRENRGPQAPRLSTNWFWMPPETRGPFYAPKVAFHIQMPTDHSSKAEWKRPGGTNWREQATSRVGERDSCAPQRQPGPMCECWNARIFEKTPWVLTLLLTPGSMEWACYHCLGFTGLLCPIPLGPTLWDNHKKSVFRPQVTIRNLDF